MKHNSYLICCLILACFFAPLVSCAAQGVMNEEWDANEMDMFLK